MRDVSYFHNNSTNSGGKSYWCKTCVKDMKTQVKHRKEKFKRNPSPCDNKLADKALSNELKEVWE
jgi:hypothetical protein